MNTAPKSLITKDKHCKNCGGAGFRYLSFYHPLRGYECMCCGTIKPEPDRTKGHRRNAMT